MGAYHPWVGPGSGRELMERLATARKRPERGSAEQAAERGDGDHQELAATLLERVHSRALELLGLQRDDRSGRHDR